MGTLTASAYLLTCCRPSLTSSFCYHIETPIFINLSSYQSSFDKNRLAQCSLHEKLNDHHLNCYNTCTDYRAWSNDVGQQRRHFFDIVCRHITHCGGENNSPKEIENEPKEEQNKTKAVAQAIKAKPEVKKKEVPKKAEVKKIVEKKNELDDTPVAPILSDTVGEKSLEVPQLETLSKPKPERRELDFKAYITEQKPTVNEDNAIITDDILDKLDCNLSNLEITFDKFVGKNRDFIQHLIECLNFEKQRQEDLKCNYCKIKQENDILRAKNEYLEMVNAKQVQLFKNELERAISENKTSFSKQAQHMERVICRNKEELEYYKKNEKKLLCLVENEKLELQNLKMDIKNLKKKEVMLIKEYVKVLNFLEDVKRTLNSSEGGSHLQRSSNTLSDSGASSLDDVLRNSLYNGIQSLNVRDLSILHDAVQQMNERLCHQNDFCGRNPVMNVTVSQVSFFNEPCNDDEYPSTDYIHKEVQDYESNLSMVPSRQCPEKKRAQFSQKLC